MAYKSLVAYFDWHNFWHRVGLVVVIQNDLRIAPYLRLALIRFLADLNLTGFGSETSLA